METARSELDALVRTLGLDALTLATGETILPGTLVAPSAPPSPAAGLSVTLPRMELARPGAASSTAELEMVSVLGRGGMGIVWAARQRVLDRTVAVKRLGAAPFAARDAAALLAEARATGALEHPAIVPVHGLGIDTDGSPLLVMKRVEGATLGELIADREHAAWAGLERRHGDRVGALLEILMRVADALELAHGKGLVHRDVKADNVMVGVLGEIYLLDWGVALRPSDVPASAPTEIVGTPAYMAPEMARGSLGAIDARTDVYLLGATLHHALTGRARHAGTTLHAVLLSALLSDPPELGPDVPAELASLIRRATAADPDERPVSAASFRDALAEFLRHRASLHLAERAIASLATLGEAPDAAALQTPAAVRALTEARFGLTQALRDWPDNAAAADALDRALGLMIEVELARASPEGARSLSRELRAPDEGLEARILAIESGVRARDALAKAALANAAESDRSRGAAARLFLAAGVVVISAIVIAFVGFLESGPDVAQHIDFGTGALIDFALVGVVGVALFIGRRRIFVNRWNRSATALVVLTMVGSGASHAVLWLRGEDLAHGDAPTQLLYAMSCAIGAVAIARTLWIASVISLGVAIVSAIHPEWSLAGSLIAISAGLTVFAWESRAQRAPGGPPP